MEFRFEGQSIEVIFAPPPWLSSPKKLFEALRKAAKDRGPEPDAHLNLDRHLSSQQPWLAFQSPTGSTRVVVRPDRANLQTNYFDDFTSPDSWQQRTDYSVAKVGAFLRLLVAVKARIAFIGIQTLARLSAKDHRLDIDRLKRAASSKFGGTSLLTEEQPCFDFSFRASRVIEPDQFSSLVLSWYQTRTFAAQVPLFGRRAVPVNVYDWQMSLTDEGLELKFDRNNKHGLLQGKTSWTQEEAVEIVRATMTDMCVAYERIDETIHKAFDELGAAHG